MSNFEELKAYAEEHFPEDFVRLPDPGISKFDNDSNLVIGDDYSQGGVSELLLTSVQWATWSSDALRAKKWTLVQSASTSSSLGSSLNF
jgi:hypothetical protein